MATITGEIELSFETKEQTIDQNQLIEFEQKLEAAIEQWGVRIHEIANECGFKVDTIRPLSLSDDVTASQYETIIEG